MSLFTDASLVMIPSGIKTSKVYSVVPTDGTGDLTFTRSNDTASRVNSSGLIEKVRTNLLLQSNQFDTTWVPLNGGAVTGGQSGYDGTNNAWLLSKSAAGGFIYQSANSYNGLYTISIYAKANASTFIRVNGNAATDSDAFFNLSTGTVQSSTNCTAKITSVGNGWYRCSISTTDTDLDYVNFYPAEAASISATSGSVLIQSAQLETGDIATEPITTLASQVSVGPKANVPRLDYSGGATCPSLLLEPQRTNSITQSEYVDSWGVKTNISVVSNDGISPEGVSNASNIYPTTTGASFFYEGSITYTSGTTYTYSVFAKANGKDYLQITTSGASFSNQYCTFDLALVATDNNGFESVGIEDYGNGWYRCYVTETSISTASSRFVIGLASNANAGRLTSVTSDGTNGVLIYGVVSEEGSFVSSYIPTYGAAVTRGADSCYKTGISSLIGATEGVMFVDINFTAKSDNNPAYIQTWNAQDQRMGLFYSFSANIIRPYLVTSGSTDFSLGFTPTVGQRYKMAFAYKANDYAFFVNGTQVTIDARATVPTAGTTIHVGCLEPTAQPNRQFSEINQALLFKTRLTNAQLAELTTI